MNPQLQGVDEIEGTYVFDVTRSVERFAINRFFWNMIRPEHRQQFLQDELATCVQAGLTPEETAMVRSRDWLGLIKHGVNFFVLEKFARVVRLSNLDVYASMRGESLDAFLATREVPEAR
jgi:hypothetical protein